MISRRIKLFIFSALLLGGLDLLNKYVLGGTGFRSGLELFMVAFVSTWLIEEVK